MSCFCSIVPPHLLESIANSKENDKDVKDEARAALQSYNQMVTARAERLEALVRSDTRNENARPRPFVPQHVLQKLAGSRAVDESTRAQAKKDLEQTAQLQASEQQTAAVKDKPARSVYDGKHTNPNNPDLPGELLRSEGQGAVEDKAANEVYDNVGKVLQFYLDKFDWHSIDDHNMDVISTVHVGKHFQNAYWTPQAQQMVFGDGHKFIYNFTNAVDVIGHELTHAVTEHTCRLIYWRQSGALNEHLSDVFGIMIKQWVQHEKAEEADWLIGEEILFPGVKGVALRSMKDPGTAYNDPKAGKDPQVSTMSKFQVITEDSGGVHLFSGIPNKAFYLVATAFGGFSWERAGQIWWQAMNSGQIPPLCSFRQFADVTVECALDAYGEHAARTVREAWETVGVTRGI